MELMRYDIFDIATNHPAGEFCNKMNRSNEWVIMCFNTDFVYYTDGVKYTGKKYQCLINPPDAPVIHGPLAQSNEGFENDWIILLGNNIGKIIKTLELPLNTSFDVTNSNCMTKFLTKLKEEESAPMFFSSEYVSNVIIDMLIYIARRRKSAQFHETDAYHTLRKIRHEMLENYSCKITLSDLSEKSGYSVSRFCELYKKFYDTSPIDDIISMRISKAKQLLTFSNLSIGEISEKCGFDSIHYFSNTFRKNIGCSPSAYRKNG